jgi:hypothetical protein
MSVSRPDQVVTAGFDSIINVYDTRTRSTQCTLESNHPFSTVAMSSCGDYLAVGNLKGEIIAYDFRNLEKVLNVKNLGQDTINRVAFVPSAGDNAEKPLKFENTRVSLLTAEEPAPVEVEKPTTQNKRDSFVDFLGFMEKKSDCNDYMSRLSIGSNTSIVEGGVRMSCGTRLSQDWRPNNHNDLIDEMFDDPPSSNINTQRLEKRKKDLNATVVDSIVAPKINAKRYSLQQPCRGSELPQIVEIDDKENTASSDDFKTPDTTRKLLKNDAHVTRRSSESTVHTSLNNISNAPDLGKPLRDEFQAVKSEIIAEIRQAQTEIWQEEMKKFEMSNAFDAERHKYHTFSVIFNTSRQLERQYEQVQADVDTIKAGMSLLLQEDPFVQAYVRMKNENDELRRRLAEYEN